MTIFKCFRADNCLKPIKEVQNLLKITPEGRYPKDSFQRYVFKCFRAYNCVKSIKEVRNLLKKFNLYPGICNKWQKITPKGR